MREARKIARGEVVGSKVGQQVGCLLFKKAGVRAVEEEVEEGKVKRKEEYEEEKNVI